jgi:hypothetical protein
MSTCENEEELIRLIRVQKQALECFPEDPSYIRPELTSPCTFPLHSLARICASGKRTLSVNTPSTEILLRPWDPDLHSVAVPI